MFFIRKFVKVLQAPFQSNCFIKCDENIEFTLVPQRLSENEDSYVISLVDEKGDFQINKITLQSYLHTFCLENVEIIYEKEIKSFKLDCSAKPATNFLLEFEIVTNIDYKEVNYVEDSYTLCYPSKLLKLLKAYEYGKVEIILQKCKPLKLNCYIKKHEMGEVEVHIVNPYNLIINDKKGDFKYVRTENYDLKLDLSFVFDPSTVLINNEEFEAVESRPESALPVIPVKGTE